MNQPAAELLALFARHIVKTREEADARVSMVAEILGPNLERAEAAMVYDDPFKMGHSVKIPMPWGGIVVSNPRSFAKHASLCAVPANEVLGSPVHALFADF
jgi:hypothetical protein